MLPEGEFILPQDTMPPGRVAVKSIFFIEKARGVSAADPLRTAAVSRGAKPPLKVLNGGTV
ncbi:hypothetical protein I4100191B2_20720 [Clostridiales bacterium]|nr:Uncharacterised protein [uncultured Flavonifractor sp.]